MEVKAPILVVEDEAPIRDGLCDILTYHGYQPTAVDNGEDGLRLALTEGFALVMLDIMLPGMNGFDVCGALRGQRPQQAILMLTARGAEEDIVRGFRCGADDYVTKPFSIAELMARLDALLRRAVGRIPVVEAPPFAFGAWRVDPAAHTASRGSATIPLSRREIEMLAVLARERGRIVSRRTLLVEVWGMAHVEHIETRTVDMHMVKLRKKIAAGAVIETVRGEGYRFSG
jgi:DNA-binding response OmpR family regulator